MSLNCIKQAGIFILSLLCVYLWVSCNFIESFSKKNTILPIAMPKQDIEIHGFFLQLYQSNNPVFELKADKAFFQDDGFVVLQDRVSLVDYRSKESRVLSCDDAKIVLNKDAPKLIYLLQMKDFNYILFEKNVLVFDPRQELKTEKAEYEIKSNSLRGESAVQIKYTQGAVLHGEKGFFLDLAKGRLTIYGKVTGEVKTKTL